jgi:hypothetical protein
MGEEMAHTKSDSNAMSVAVAPSPPGSPKHDADANTTATNNNNKDAQSPSLPEVLIGPSADVAVARAPQPQVKTFRAK